MTRMKESRPADLTTRLALRPKEAAAALGISERKFRQIAHRLPSVWLDGVRLFPTALLAGWLHDEAKRAQTESDAEAAAILTEMSGVRD